MEIGPAAMGWIVLDNVVGVAAVVFVRVEPDFASSAATQTTPIIRIASTPNCRPAFLLMAFMGFISPAVKPRFAFRWLF